MSEFAITQAVFMADDGVEKQTALVDNQMCDNTLGFHAERALFLGGDWTAGAELEGDFFHFRSDEINSIDKKQNFGAEVGDASLWIQHRFIGTPRASSASGMHRSAMKANLTPSKIKAELASITTLASI